MKSNILVLLNIVVKNNIMFGNKICVFNILSELGDLPVLPDQPGRLPSTFQTLLRRRKSN